MKKIVLILAIALTGFSTYAQNTATAAKETITKYVTTFPNGDVNSLMTSSIGPGQANHNPGFITLGFFQDMGWSICPGALSVDDFTVSNVAVSPNPFVDEITVTLNKAYSDSFELNLIDINGRLIMSQKSYASNGKLTLSNLIDLDDALYFVKITNSTTGNSITLYIVV